MSSIVSAVTGGGSGGGAGMGFEAKGASLINPVTQQQTDQAYLNTQTGLGQQEDFLKALQAQNGLSNQSNVFNQQQGIANGTGANPAQAMLANATGANVANQNAMMAGQRGSGTNVGMMARQAANQGANIQQQAAGQGAALQANQSLNALNQMGGLATNQANQLSNANNAYTNSALSQQQNLLGGVGAYNNANVGMQSNMNTTNAAVSGVTAGQQGNMMGNMMGGIGSMAQMIPKMGSMFGGSSGMTGADSGMGMMGGGAGDAGSLSGASDFMMAAQGGMIPKKMAVGGPVQTPMIPSGDTPLDPSLAQGPQSNVGKSFMDTQDSMGAFDPNAPVVPIQPKGGAIAKGGGPGMEDAGQGIIDSGVNMFKGILPMAGSAVGDFFGGPIGGQIGGIFGSGLSSLVPNTNQSEIDEAKKLENEKGRAALAGTPKAAADGDTSNASSMFAAKGGRVPAMVSPGEQYLKPNEVEKVKKGANPLQEGERIPGKPKVKGNSYANDVVPKTLESGGIVIPNSIMQSKDAEKKAAAFVKAVLAKQGLKKGLR